MVVGRRKDLPDADLARVDQVGVGQQVAGREVWVRPWTVSRSAVAASVVPHG